MEKKKATLVITHNSVEGYKPGVQNGKNGPVIIYNDYDRTPRGPELRKEGLEQMMHDMYGRVSSEDVEKIYLYIGRHVSDDTLGTAQKLASYKPRTGHDNLFLVGCFCERWYEKNVPYGIKAVKLGSECGGRETLGRIVGRLINGQNND